jgi:hypothetical protein
LLGSEIDGTGLVISSCNKFIVIVLFTTILVFIYSSFHSSISVSIVEIVKLYASFNFKTLITFIIIIKKLRGLNPRENYTDRETAACRRS